MAADPQTLVDLLRERAAGGASRLAYTFLDDGVHEGDRLTYGALDDAARRIAVGLHATHPPGARALLLFPAGLDFLRAFFGCLYAGLIAIPAPPPEASRRKRTVPRLHAIARDADVSLVLSTGDTLSLVRETCGDVPERRAMRFVDVADPGLGDASAWQQAPAAPGDLAYLQYTSGSTTTPKGVMLTHRNVLRHCADLRERCGYGPDSISVTWLPYFHDYGLIEGLLVPLQNGTPCHVMSPFAFLKRPFAWLNAISKYRATHTQAPNFAYDQCCRRMKPEQLAQLDLSCLRSAGNGAEPVNPEVVEAFLAMYGPRGFRADALCPAYGLAEATLMMTCAGPGTPPRIGRFRAAALADGRVEPTEDMAEPARRVTSCGHALGRIQIELVDPETRLRVEPGRVGEVWVKDDCVALGYWKRPAETGETFGARLADTGEGPFLRTGDLAFFHAGELYITSRIKDLIIVAGANHHPQDIEWTVEACHPALRRNHVAAFSIDVRGEERLAVACELERGSIGDGSETQVIFDAIRRAIVEEHEIPVHAVALLDRGSLPKTSSGKLQRHGCDRFLAEDAPEVVARWSADGTRAERPTAAAPRTVTLEKAST